MRKLTMVLLLGLVFLPIFSQEEHSAELTVLEPIPSPFILNTIMTETIETKEIIFEPQIISPTFDVLIPSGYSKEELSLAFDYGNYANMLPYLNTFLEAEETYGVNALYLICKLGLESGWTQHQGGLNNIGGWTRNDGSLMDFESIDHCILYIAEKISTTYKDTVGTTLKSVCERYNPYSDYMYTLMDIMQQRENKIIERSIL